MAILDDAVNSFLAWRLPKDFCPDAGISFTPPAWDIAEIWWPTGTNLFTAYQARTMIEHIAGEALAELEDEIKALREQVRWVPVSERLPESRKAVLVRCPENLNTFCACYAENAGPRWTIFGASKALEQQVTHWMPLPVPPQEQSDE
jgi:Protein of unknown function (DUF551)